MDHPSALIAHVCVTILTDSHTGWGDTASAAALNLDNSVTSYTLRERAPRLSRL
jgi:hypothetical protein